MKVAVSSGSFSEVIAAGGLTQLEWLERCADGIGADGVIFDRTHFARTDREYIDQIKKVTVDLGLVPLAIADERLFDPDLAETQRLSTIELAAALGALFILSRLPSPGDVPPATFVAVVNAAKVAVKAAKKANVTLLVEPVAGTLAESIRSLRHFLKDVDSAWLRFALPAGTDRSELGMRDRALVITLGEKVDPAALSEINEGTRPWILLAGPVDSARIAAVHRAGAAHTGLVEPVG